MSFKDVLGDLIFAGMDRIEDIARGVDKTVMKGIDAIGVVEDAVVDFANENPKTAAVVGTVAAGAETGGLAYVAAPVIATGLGAAGALGAASTGATISTLSGAALTNASLAAIGGGAIAAGGGGMAAGTVVVAATGAAVGTSAAATAAVVKGKE